MATCLVVRANDLSTIVWLPAGLRGVNDFSAIMMAAKLHRDIPGAVILFVVS